MGANRGRWMSVRDAARAALASFAIGLAVLWAVPGHAQSVSVVGPPGAPGADGGANEDGRPGEDAPIATAIAGPSAANQNATATGGTGGAGGRGGLPDGDGGAGGAGGDANAQATTTGAANSSFVSAAANGGRGGAGGLAASAVVGAAGVGGTGGQGGDATATAISDALRFTAYATSTAMGGIGGGATGAGARGGDGGSATATARSQSAGGASSTADATGGAGGSGTAGADGGDGGSVVLDSASTVAIAVGSSTSAAISQTARGGLGGFSEYMGGAGGDGGDASTRYVGTGVVDSSLNVTLSSMGGDAGNGFLAGGRGGDADASGSIAAIGGANLRLTSGGGVGGSIYGTGSGATGAAARADGSASSVQGPASISAIASGGRGSAARGAGEQAGAGGRATATAVASTSAPNGQANALVSVVGGEGGSGSDGARPGDGASVELIDAVRGTGADVVLRQEAYGGRGGRLLSGDPTTPGAQSGAATSRITAANPVGHVTLVSRAQAGETSGSGAIVGRTLASGAATASGRVDVRVEAIAGSIVGTPDGLTAPSAGLAEIERARGVSTGGGEVLVQAILTAGRGVSGRDASSDGGNARLVDVADGATSGDLWLTQDAHAGAGGNASPFASTSATAGQAGDAFNRIAGSRSARTFGVRLNSFGGEAGHFGSTAVEGGSATSEVDAHNDAGAVVVDANGTGGSGSRQTNRGFQAGAGGEARLVLTGRTDGDGHDVRIGTLSGSVAQGGAGGFGSSSSFAFGGQGGNASTEAVGEARGNGQVDVVATAIGGSGGAGSNTANVGPSGNGGVADARATGTNAGSRAVNVTASATGGLGGTSVSNIRGGRGGAATARAHGVSTGGGNVTATARVIGGSADDSGLAAEGVLQNAVSGATTGRLRLVQEATGGGGFYESNGANARSDLTWDDDDGGALELVSSAIGGRGPRGGGAIASVVGTGQEDVSVRARVEAGSNLLSTSPPATVGFGRVFGESRGGGRVISEAELEAADGVDVSQYSTATRAGSGGDAVLDSVVDGATAGILELIQRAKAGHAGGFDPGYLPGDAGNAISRIARAGSSAELRTRVEATGGDGSWQNSTGFVPPGTTRHAAGNGGRADAESISSNDAGRVVLAAHAAGGRGGAGYDGGQGGNGGHAMVRAHGTSLGETGDVTIGGVGLYGAVGGIAYKSPSYNRPGPAGLGGDASSESIGLARGDGRIDVQDRATGGSGATGGAATSFAAGTNHGGLDVRVVSTATGGAAVEVGGFGGAARAISNGSSRSGAVRVDATASSTRSAIAHANAVTIEDLAAAPVGVGSLDGSIADAFASATGVEGEARARARAALDTVSGQRIWVAGAALAPVRSAAQAGVEVGAAALPGLFGAEDAKAIVGASTDASTGLASASLWLRARQSALDITLETEASIGGLEIESLDGFRVAFPQVSVASLDFDSLEFSIRNGSQLLLERTFLSPAEATAFFVDAIELGPLASLAGPSLLDLHFGMRLSGAPRNAFAGVVLDVTRTVIPEPGTALLVCLGLAGLSARRTRSA